MKYSYIKTRNENNRYSVLFFLTHTTIGRSWAENEEKKNPEPIINCYLRKEIFSEKDKNLLKDSVDKLEKRMQLDNLKVNFPFTLIKTSVNVLSYQKEMFSKWA